MSPLHIYTTREAALCYGSEEYGNYGTTTSNHCTFFDIFTLLQNRHLLIPDFNVTIFILFSIFETSRVTYDKAITHVSIFLVLTLISRGHVLIYYLKSEKENVIKAFSYPATGTQGSQ